MNQSSKSFGEIGSICGKAAIPYITPTVRHGGGSIIV